MKMYEWSSEMVNGCMSGEMKKTLYLSFIVKVETFHGHFPSLFLITFFGLFWHFWIFTILSQWFTYKTIKADPESAPVCSSVVASNNPCVFSTPR